MNKFLLVLFFVVQSLRIIARVSFIMDVVQRMKNLLPFHAYRTRRQSSLAALALESPLREKHYEPLSSDAHAQSISHSFERHCESVQAIDDMSGHLHQSHVAENKKSRNGKESMSFPEIQQNCTENAATQTMNQEPVISLVERPDQMIYCEDLANKLVLINDGKRSGVALMLSQQACDEIVEALQGNRDTFIRGTQRDANVAAYERHIDKIDEFASSLDTTEKSMREAALTGPSESQTRALLSIKTRRDELFAARHEVFEADKRESENFKSIQSNQLGRCHRLCCTLDGNFVAAGSLPEVKFPDYENCTPDFDNNLFADLPFDMTQLQRRQSHVTDEGELLSGEEDPSSDPVAKFNPAKNQPYNHVDIDEIEETTSESQHKDVNDEEPAQSTEEAEPDLEISVSSDNEKSELTVTQPGDFARFATDEDAYRAEFLLAAPESVAPESEDHEQPWSDFEPGLQYIVGIGGADVLPLGQWAPLLGNREVLRADVWKYCKELWHCDELLDTLQNDLDNIQEEKSNREPTEDLLSEMESQSDAVTRIEERMQQTREYVALCEVRHSLALFRARWIGHEIDSTGQFNEDESDYFADDAKCPSSDKREALIESWREGIEGGVEESAEEPDLDEWHAGDEVQPWENPADKYDLKSYNGYLGSYEQDVKQYFEEMETCK